MSLCLTILSQVACGTTLHMHSHPAVILQAMQLHLGYRYAGFLYVGSIVLLFLVFIPLIRRGWLKRALIDDIERQGGSVVPRKNKSTVQHKSNAGKEQKTSLESSDSLEEVQLSFGTDKPEVYLKMCKPLQQKRIRPSPFFCELLVQ